MKKDILQVIAGTAILGIIMDIVFLLIGKFDITVLFGTLLGVACASLNFCFLAYAVKQALGRGKSAIGYMGISYILRLFFIGVVVVISIKLPYFNYIATAIPLLFPRVIITLIQGIMKWKSKSKAEEGDNFGGA